MENWRPHAIRGMAMINVIALFLQGPARGLFLLARRPNHTPIHNGLETGVAQKKRGRP